MKGPDWNSTNDSNALQTLLGEGRGLDFPQAVRFLQALHPEAAEVGGGDSAGEPLRFRASAGLGFPTADIESIETLREGSAPRHRMTVNFLGLYGPTSPLPMPFNERVIAEERDIDEEDERSVRPFLDLFNHRFISLFYQCWRKYRYYERYQRGGGDDFSRWMFSLIGVGALELRQGAELEWSRLLPHVGLLGMGTRSAAVIAGTVSHYFGDLPVAVEQCVERRVSIDADQRNRLGAANSRLGVDLTVGERVRDRGGKFRLRLGPLSFAIFSRFVPVGDAYRPLRRLLDFILLDRLDYDVELVLEREEIPPLELARAAEGRCLLGWSTWLGHHPDHDGEVLTAA